MTGAEARPEHPDRVVQWAQEHGEVGGVRTSHRQMSEVLRSAGHEVLYLDTGSVPRAARVFPSLWHRRTLHVLHVTRLWRAAPLAPLLGLLPGRSVLVLHSGSTARQLSSMSPWRRSVVLGILRTFDDLWVVNAAIRDELPASLAARTTVVTPFDPRAGGAATVTLRDPHLLVLATNAGLAHYNARAGIEAVRLVREQWPEATLRVLAYGHDGPELEALRREVDGVVWAQLSFDLSPQQVRSVLAGAGVFLRPTLWDGDSMVVREALALGARVVASDLAPRPKGVEVTGIAPRVIAEAVLTGGRVSDGSGLVDTTLADAASRALESLG